MSDISNHVLVQIDRTTKFPTKVGFGTPLILDINVKQTNEVDVVTDIADVEALGFVAADQAHKAASSIFNQSPHPEKVLIGKRAANVAQVDTIVIGGFDDGTYTISINTVDFSFVASSSSITAIRDALVAAINGGSEPVTAAPVSTDTLTLTADVAGTGFSTVLTSNPIDNMVLTLTTPNTGVASELARISQINNDWYFLLLTSRTEQDILAAVNTIETLIKVFFFETDQADSKGLPFGTDTTSILGQIKALNVMRTVGLWTKTSNLPNYPTAAWIGLNAPEEGGSITWKFKQARGVLADDELTSTEESNILGKNANIYNTVAGIAIFAEGTTMDGDFFDLTRGTDQLSSRIQESVFALFIQEKKVPYTDGGGEQINTALKEPLQTAEDDLFLAPDPKFTTKVPKVADIPAVDRAARFFKDIEFEATLAGAIHKAKFIGRLSV